MIDDKWTVYKESILERGTQLLLIRKAKEGYEFASMIEEDNDSIIWHGIRSNNIPSSIIRSISVSSPIPQ